MAALSGDAQLAVSVRQQGHSDGRALEMMSHGDPELVDDLGVRWRCVLYVDYHVFLGARAANQ